MHYCFALLPKEKWSLSLEKVLSVCVCVCLIVGVEKRLSSYMKSRIAQNFLHVEVSP